MTNWTSHRTRAQREDAAFMAHHGECLTGAAHRLGVTLTALEKTLLRADDLDIYRELLTHEPTQRNQQEYSMKHTDREAC